MGDYPDQVIYTSRLELVGTKVRINVGKPSSVVIHIRAREILSIGDVEFEVEYTGEELDDVTPAMVLGLVFIAFIWVFNVLAFIYDGSRFFMHSTIRNIY